MNCGATVAVVGFGSSRGAPRLARSFGNLTGPVRTPLWRIAPREPYSDGPDRLPLPASTPPRPRAAVMDLSLQLSANPAAALPILFGAGMLTSLTPCVYPMIPITAAIGGGQSGV